MILEDGVLATVEDADGDPGGGIRAVADGELARSWWAIVLPGM